MEVVIAQLAIIVWKVLSRYVWSLIKGLVVQEVQV